MIDPEIDVKNISESDFPGGFIPLPAPKESKRNEKDNEES